jgi:hypothetical protein
MPGSRMQEYFFPPMIKKGADVYYLNYYYSQGKREFQVRHAYVPGRPIVGDIAFIFP